jgi:immune inhibitor A
MQTSTFRRMGMFRLVTLAVIMLAVGFVAGETYSMPVRPDLVDELRAQGRLDEEGAFMEDAYARGFNNPDYEAVPGLLRSGAPLALTTGKAIVLLVDFTDNVADVTAHPISHYEELMFSADTHVYGSMRDYYLENSYGVFDVTGGVSGWYRMPQTYAYYVDGQRGFGTYPRNAKKLTEDAVLAADPYVDFSQYDCDGPDGIPNSGDDDGYVDALFVVHAGPGYESTLNPQDIHSHAGYTSYAMPVDGVLVRRYSMEPEDGNVGVFAHEFGHVLGLPDLYDYGYDSEGAGKWSLMASGSWGLGGQIPSHIDAWGKIRLGFVTPVVPTGNLIEEAVLKAEVYPVAYKVWTNGSPGSQYFILEHRRKTLFDFMLPAKGLIIYHVDDSMSNNNSQMCGSGSPHYRVAVEQADGECDLENNNNDGDSGDPWPGTGGTYNPNTSFNLNSTPNTRAYDDSPTGVSFYNIRFADGIGYVSIAVAEVAPTVTVTYPNGGESLEGGTQATIGWIAFDDLAVDSICVKLSTDGGGTFPQTLCNGEPNDSAFTWDITGVSSSTCRIKVIAYDSNGNTAEDISDTDFEVSGGAGVPAGETAGFEILLVSPNPSTAGTRIVFSSPAPGASVEIYDVAGRRVKDLSGAISPGASNTYEAHWDGTSSGGKAMSPGVYFVRVSTGDRTRTAGITIAR